MKTRSIVGACADKGRVLGEEAVARVDGRAARRLSGRDDGGDGEVALGRGRWADADRAVSQARVERVAVGGRIDGDSLDAELVERADHADGDLPAVGDEDSLEHRGA